MKNVRSKCFKHFYFQNIDTFKISYNVLPRQAFKVKPNNGFMKGSDAISIGSLPQTRLAREKRYAPICQRLCGKEKKRLITRTTNF
jgi:hypothetical protein